MTKTYCCVQFMETVGQGVERGMAIVPTRNLKFGDFFFLRFRCVAEEYVNSIPDTGDILLSRYLLNKLFNIVRGVVCA